MLKLVLVLSAVAVQLISGQLELCHSLVGETKPDYFRVGSKRMLMLYQEKNWTEAKADCEARGMKLLTPSSQQNNIDLRDALNKRIWENRPVADIIYWYLWTSGNDVDREGVWKWDTTGELFTYTSWLSKDEPNGGRAENCMELRMVAWDHTLWNDANCENKKRYICEAEDGGLV